MLLLLHRIMDEERITDNKIHINMLSNIILYLFLVIALIK